MLTQFRATRIDRSYRRIAKLELKVGLAHPTVQGGRLGFASETMAMLDRGLIAQNVPRQARRRMQRALATGRGGTPRRASASSARQTSD
jgi:hypothetical protein